MMSSAPQIFATRAAASTARPALSDPSVATMIRCILPLFFDAFAIATPTKASFRLTVKRHSGAFRVANNLHGAQDARGIDADGVDAELRQIARDLGIIGRGLSADAYMTRVALGAGDREPQHLQHARVSFVKIEGDDFGVAIDPQRKLRQIVGADRETVE